MVFVPNTTDDFVPNTIDVWLGRADSAAVSPGTLAGASASSEPLVYLGKRKEGKFRSDFSGGSVRGGAPGDAGVYGPPNPGVTPSVDFPLGIKEKPVDVPDVRTQSDAEAEWDAWEDQERQQWAQHLIEAGVLAEEDRWDYATLQKWWFTLVDESARKYTNAGKEIDPWQMAVIYGGGDESGATASSLERGILGEGGADAPLQRYTQSTRSRNVDLTDPSTAKALVNQVLGRALGRNASDEEIAEFTSVLNDAERANPVVSKSRTVYNLRDDQSGYDTSTSTTTRGGVDAGQVLSDEAMDSREYKYYQGATTYGDALQAALATVGGN